MARNIFKGDNIIVIGEIKILTIESVTLLPTGKVKNI